MRKKIIAISVILFLVGLLNSQDKLSPFDILDRVDKNTFFTTAYAEIDMVITIKNRKITKTMISYSEGNEKSFIEFLSPARDKGTKILKVNDIIKIYYPSAERIMRLSGHMLRQSMMGSDFSYEDMTERVKKLREEYTGEILEDENVEGHNCYVMVLTSKNPKKTYYRRKIWVDKKRYVGLKEELYSKGGKLLKVMNVDKVEVINKRYYPTSITLKDKLRKNSSTTMIIKKIEFDIPIPAQTFTERQLMKK